jgi:hypothetical protein
MVETRDEAVLSVQPETAVGYAYSGFGGSPEGAGSNWDQLRACLPTGRGSYLLSGMPDQYITDSKIPAGQDLSFLSTSQSIVVTLHFYILGQYIPEIPAMHIFPVQD